MSDDIYVTKRVVRECIHHTSKLYNRRHNELLPIKERDVREFVCMEERKVGEWQVGQATNSKSDDGSGE